MVKHILLVDDDPDDADLFLQALKDIGLDVSFEYLDNGLKIPEWFDRIEALFPDIIFLDINMPNITGWDCLTWLKGQERLRQVPVIMYTTSNSQQDKDKARLFGAIGVIVKPDNYPEIKSTLRNFLSDKLPLRDFT